MTRPLRIVAIADTDSYVKWAAALLGSLGEGWDAALVVLRTPLVVSPSQLAGALLGSGLPAGAVSVVEYSGLAARLAELDADAVLLAGRGPLVRVLARDTAAIVPRAVLVTGLPGISIPATRKALIYRTQCDLFVVHSHRERRAFEQSAREGGFAQRFALATLPFARGLTGMAARGTDLVFAAQAKVPALREDRLRIARTLVRAAEADPSRRVVVKLRAEKGEHQTHAERDTFPSLLASLGELPANLVVSTAPMRRALDTAEGLVTVSSTAAVEAVARGIPVIALDTFGVSSELINEVFNESGLFGDDDDVIARRFRQVDPGWLHDNYLHPLDDDDWAERTRALVERRRAGLLAPRMPYARRGGALRDAWERRTAIGRDDRTASGAFALAVGIPARAVVRAGQRARRMITAA